MTEIVLTGYLYEVGDFNTVQRRDGKTGRGITIDAGTEHGDVTLIGLTKAQCKELAQYLRGPLVEIRITAELAAETQEVKHGD